jgi:hypothetical protein
MRIPFYLRFTFGFIGLYLCSFSSQAQNGYKALENIPSNEVSIIDITPTGKVWAGTYDNGCAVFAGTTWSNFDTTNTPMRSDSVVSICLYNIATVLHSFMGTANGVAYKFGTTWDTLGPLPGPYVCGIVKSGNDSLWVGTRNAVSLFDGTTLVHIADYDSSLSYFPFYGLSCMQSNTVTCTGFAAGTQANGFFYTSDGATYTHETVASGNLANDSVNCIYAEATCGNYYVGTQGGLSFSSAGSCTNYHVADGLPSEHITALTMDCKNRLWIGTDMGISVYDGATFYNINTSNGLSTNLITTIACDTACSCWIGTQDKGIIIIDSSLTHISAMNVNTGIATVAQHNDIKIYPQPACDMLSFEIPSSVSADKVTIIDVTGRLLQSTIVYPNGGHFSIDIHSLPDGIYTYVLSDKNSTLQSGKVVVVR